MDESMLLDGVLRSVLGGRRKRSRSAMRYLGGPLAVLGRSAGRCCPIRNVLLTAAGVAWGIFETLQQGSAAGTSAPGVRASDPTASRRRNDSPLPPLPDVGTSAAPISDQALQIVRLAISAAYADGSVSDRSGTRSSSRRAAREWTIVEQELAQPRPLAEIVAGVTDDDQRATLYVLAFGIVRGDEQPTGAERIYLAKLAHLLGLDPKTVQQLEQNAAQRIDAEPEQ